jgi:hypothetical protein
MLTSVAFAVSTVAAHHGGGTLAAILAALSLLVFGLVFPTDASATPNQAAVSRGSGYLYYAPSTTAGADPGTVFGIGPTTGGIEVDSKRTLTKIDCDQFIGPIGAFPSGEDWQIKASFLHDNWANHYNTWSTLGAESPTTAAANLLTGGTVAAPAGSMTMGESWARRYMQMLWKGPGPGEQVTRTMQFWRCVPQGPGTWKLVKNKERTFSVAWQVVADPAAYAANRGAVGIGIDA